MVLHLEKLCCLHSEPHEDQCGYAKFKEAQTKKSNGLLRCCIISSELIHSLLGAEKREKTQEVHETYKTWKVNKLIKLKKFQGSQSPHP